MQYCLNVDELNQLIESHRGAVEITDKALLMQLENARQWQTELVCLSFLFARLLERKKNRNVAPDQMIRSLFSLKEEMYLYIQECGAEFVEYMLSYKSFSDLGDSLEDILIDIQNRMSEHRYERTLRY